MENLGCVPDTFEVIYVNLNYDYLKVKVLFFIIFYTLSFSQKYIDS